jgi:Fic family protein
MDTAAISGSTGLTLRDLKAWPPEAVESLYDRLGHDYASESRCAEHGEPKGRRRLLEAVAFLREPTSEEIRRLFNQINTHFAEARVFEGTQRLGVAVTDLLELNRLLLFRQGKPVGPRVGRGVFGARDWLPARDIARASKLFEAVPPNNVIAMLNEWVREVPRFPHSVDGALFAAMTIVAIHPFSDANGRLARVVFSWLTGQWLNRLIWLDEDANGEFARAASTGLSTTYLMMEVVRDIGHGTNVIPYGAQVSEDSQRISAGIKRTIQDAANGTMPESIYRLRRHMEIEGHLLNNSPRFRSLEGIIAS